METIWKIIVDILVYLSIATGMSYFFFHIKRKDLIGGYTGGLVIGVLGAILGSHEYVFYYPATYLLKFLQEGIGNVNLLASLAGSFLSLYVYNKINHNRTRVDKY